MDKRVIPKGWWMGVWVGGGGRKWVKWVVGAYLK